MASRLTAAWSGSRPESYLLYHFLGACLLDVVQETSIRAWITTTISLQSLGAQPVGLLQYGVICEGGYRPRCHSIGQHLVEILQHEVIRTWEHLPLYPSHA